MKRITRRSTERRSGSALIFALTTVTLVAGISYSMLKITHFVGQRQAATADDKRAFYLAEAGLSEAYFGLSRGYTGEIGVADAPVRVGDGLVWVEATDGAGDLVTLRATGLCDSGRSTLEITVEREEVKLGIFADEGIDLDVPFLVDGYDSEQGTYTEQVGGGVIQVLPSYAFTHVDEANSILFYEGVFYRFYDIEGNKFAYDDVFDPAAHPEWAEKYDIDWDDFVDGEDDHDGIHPDFNDIEYVGVLAYFASLGASETPAFELPLPDSDTLLSDVDPTEGPPADPGSSLGPTTGIGGILSSNGDISLSSPDGTIELFGDVYHGQGGEALLNGVVVTGTTGALPETVELSVVLPPEVEFLPGFVHDSAIPRVIPSGDVGYESVRVRPDSELVILGPGNAVFGDLELEEASLLSVENLDGKVELFVTGHVGLGVGAQVQVASGQSEDLTLQVVGSPESVDLFANSNFRGGIYAPDSHVQIGKDFELFGYLISNTLSLEPGTRLHFDSGMETGLLVPRLVGWKIEEIPAGVRQNRGDPFRIFFGDGDEPDDISDSMKSDCWSLKIQEYRYFTPLAGYEGPANAYVPDPNATGVVIDAKDLKAPDTGSRVWFVRAVSKSAFSTAKTYEGPFADFPGAMGTLEEWVVWSE